MAPRLRLRAGFFKHLTPAKREQGEVSEVMGAPKDGTKRYLDEEPDVGMKVTGHTILGVLFYAAFLVYLIFTVINYVTAPKPATMSMKPAQQVGAPLLLNVTATCMWGSCGAISVVENYTNYPNSPCYARAGPTGYRASPLSSGSSAVVSLCYTGEETPIIASNTVPIPVSMVQLFFSPMLPNSFVNVTVVSVGDNGGAISRALGLEPSVYRVFTLGATYTTMDGVVESFLPYGLTYETERDLTLLMSAVQLRLNPVVNWNQRTSGPTPVDLLASLGNALESLDRIFLVLIPVAMFIFKRSQEDEEETQATKPTPPLPPPPTAA